MGLDMYLNRKRYIKNWDHASPEHRSEVTLSVGGTPISLHNPTYIIEEVGYWRKANAIHKFFCDLDGGKDECQEIYVGQDQLTDLLVRCEAILADHSKAPELLPTQGGFFFGGTDYDHYYFEDLEATIKIIKPLLRSDDDEPTPSSGDYYYEASW
jgi:hypothetical protein